MASTNLKRYHRSWCGDDLCIYTFWPDELFALSTADVLYQTEEDAPAPDRSGSMTGCTPSHRPRPRFVLWRLQRRIIDVTAVAAEDGPRMEMAALFTGPAARGVKDALEQSVLLWRQPARAGLLRGRRAPRRALAGSFRSELLLARVGAYPKFFTSQALPFLELLRRLVSHQGTPIVRREAWTVAPTASSGTSCSGRRPGHPRCSRQGGAWKSS